MQVFGITRDPLIVWSSNMFAIASLRALYSVVIKVMKELRFLEKSVAIVLAWIGVKVSLLTESHSSIHKANPLQGSQLAETPSTRRRRS